MSNNEDGLTDEEILAHAHPAAIKDADEMLTGLTDWTAVEAQAPGTTKQMRAVLIAAWMVDYARATVNQ